MKRNLTEEKRLCHVWRSAGKGFVLVVVDKRGNVTRSQYADLHTAAREYFRACRRLRCSRKRYNRHEVLMGVGLKHPPINVIVEHSPGRGVRKRFLDIFFRHAHIDA
jgi:hypothetical protein